MTSRLPARSCDGHLHVFGDAARYPVANPNALYAPPQDCTIEAIQALHAELGIERAVFVQPTAYGTDHSLLHDLLAADTHDRYRGVAIVDDTVSDAELARLHAVGVRGARFNFGGRFKLAPDLAGFRRTLARVSELGWYAKFFGFGDDLLAVEGELRKLQTPAMIDHLGGCDFSKGTSQPLMRLLLELLARDNWWIGLSNGDLRSKTGKPWNDAMAFGRMLFDAAPTRCVWGTDWPHVHRLQAPSGSVNHHGDEPIDAAYEMERVGLLERYLPDPALRGQVLVDNAARFFGFGQNAAGAR